MEDPDDGKPKTLIVAVSRSHLLLRDGGALDLKDESMPLPEEIGDPPHFRKGALQMRLPLWQEGVEAALDGEVGLAFAIGSAIGGSLKMVEVKLALKTPSTTNLGAALSARVVALITSLSHID